MRSILAVSLLVLSIQTPSTPQGHPTPYPDGKFCTPKGDLIGRRQTTDHPCACKRHDMAASSDPEAKKMCQAGEPVDPSHDPVCKQECSEQHCACPIGCDVAGHAHPAHGTAPTKSSASPVANAGTAGK